MDKSISETHVNTNTQSDPRWQAVIRRDPAAEGQFYYAVTTTGVYCRPTCGARLPRPEHVIFYENPAQAAQAGFRPCKRCRPDQPDFTRRNAAVIEAACRTLEKSPDEPPLETLADQAGMSKYHFHRLFKQATGLTPRQYAFAQREARVRAKMTESSTVTEAIYDAGYNANSRFYEKSGQVLGMTPSAYRSGGKNAQIRFAIGECSLGSILVAESERGLCAILLGDDPEALLRDLQDRFPQAELLGGQADFEQRVALVVGFVESPKIGLDLPLDIRGTAFQQRVWQALRQIPAGKTASYSEVAGHIGAPKAVRAVAQACAANALAVAIPCHRVVRNDGSLSGYRWGVERKKALLQRESEQG